MQPPTSTQPAQPAAPQGQYEFTEAQNRVIAKLASRMRLAGVIQIVFGSLQLLGNCGLSTGEGSLKLSSSASPVYLALVVAGAILIAAAASFRRIVDTEGKDITHLMEALSRLSTSILVQLITYAVLGLLLVLAIVALIVILLFFAAALGSMIGS